MFGLKRRQPNYRAEICSAIGGRRVIRFSYGEGARGGMRVVEPYCYGRLADGEETLLCYQVSGYDSFDVPVGWKLYRPSKMSNLEVSTETFALRRSNPVCEARFRLFVTIYSRLMPAREVPSLQAGGIGGAEKEEIASQ